MAKRKPKIDRCTWTLDQLVKQYKNPYAKDLSMHEMIRNRIRTSCKEYDGKDFKTTLESVYFLMHGHKKEDVLSELSKWVDLTNVELDTPIILPQRFLHT